MGIEAASSAMTVSNTSPSTTSSSVSTKTNSDTSFKEEMSKVTKTEDKSETKETSDKSEKTTQLTSSKEKSKTSETKTSDKKVSSKNTQENLNNINMQIAINPQYSFNEANMMLTGDIQQMIENSSSINSLNDRNWTLGFGTDTKSNLSMNESDAEFFLNLTQNGDVSMNNIVAQGQNMLNAGIDVSEVKQNVQVSQTLLNALNEARQNNQPIRIDFDQNISVILRVGRDGSIAAQFIPGDKIAEQYLKQNINELRSSFDEQDIPYSELSYSNSSKEQNQKRREEKRQGEQ